MARTVQTSAILLRARRRADMATSGFVASGSEDVDVMNDEWPEVYRLLVECGPPDTYAASTTITTIAQTLAYALPSDCYQPTAVFALETNQYRRPLDPIGDSAIARFQPPQAAYSILLEYIPAPPVLTGTGGETIDGIAGFDSLLTARMARRFLEKRKADTSAVDRDISELTSDIRRQGRRARGPRFLPDEEDSWGYPYLVQINGYRVRGSNVELYQPRVVWP